MNVKQVIERLKHRKPFLLGLDQLPKYAVLLPLVELNNETHVLFEVRAMTLRRQPGEICFPGGRIEKNDPHQQHTAIRETSEELGIDEDDITDIIPLDIMLNSTSNVIYPFVGKINHFEKIKPNEFEVGEVFTVPLKFLLENEPEIYRIHFRIEPEENFPFDLIHGGRNYKWQDRHLDEYFYQYNGKVIWGITARILTNFLELLKTD
jgi:peroxisomal coenzyme A diphosphatase NUDT7